METPSKRKLGCAWFCVPLLLIIVGIALPAIPIIKAYGKPTYTKRFVAPGSTEVQVAQAGGYMLWFENRTIYEGRTYSANSSLPSGLEMKLRNKETDETIPLSKTMNAHVTVGGEERHSVASFNLPAPGKYELTVSGTPSTQSMVFSFRRDWFWNVFRSVFVLGIFGAVMVFAAIIALIVIFVLRCRR
jgi:hypothetical protein